VALLIGRVALRFRKGGSPLIGMVALHSPEQWLRRTGIFSITDYFNFIFSININSNLQYRSINQFNSCSYYSLFAGLISSYEKLLLGLIGLNEN
jgi:hypothetical protein